MLYSTWDEVVLKIPEDFGYGDKVNAPLKVMVLGSDFDNVHMQYLCYISPGERIPFEYTTFTISDKHIKRFAAEKKFLGETGCIISSQNDIFSHVEAVKGEKCDRCGNFFEGAKRVDSKFKCLACRQNPWR